MADKYEITVFQHYLPQTWLKRFTYNANKSSVYAYDTENNEKMDSKPIKNIAGEDLFYDFHPKVFNELVKSKKLDSTKEKQFVEKQFFSYNIERKLGALLTETVEALEISNAGEKVLDERLKFSLTIHFAIQYFRGRVLRDLTHEILRHLEDLISSNEKYEELKFSPEEELTYMHFLLMQQSIPLINFATDIFSSPWVVFKASTEKKFVISDNPFVINKHEWGRNICIPISKDYLIVIYNKHLPKEFDLALIELSSKLRFSVSDFNQLQYQQSYKQIYSSENDFLWINQKTKKENLSTKLQSTSNPFLKELVRKIVEKRYS